MLLAKKTILLAKKRHACCLAKKQAPKGRSSKNVAWLPGSGETRMKGHWQWREEVARELQKDYM